MISSPPTSIRPASIGSSRLTQRRSVDLPRPGRADEADDLVLARPRGRSRRGPRSVPNDLRRPGRCAAPEPPGRAADRGHGRGVRHRAAAEARARSRATSQSTSRAIGIVSSEEDERDVIDVGREVERRGLADLRRPEDLDDAEDADTSAVSFWRPMKSLRSGGITRRIGLRDGRRSASPGAGSARASGRLPPGSDGSTRCPPGRPRRRTPSRAA